MTSSRDLLVVVGAWSERGGLQRRWKELTDHLREDRRVTVLTWAPALRPSVTTDGAVAIVTVPCLVSWDRDHARFVEIANTLVSVTTAVVAALVLRRRWRIAVGAGLHPEAVVAGLAARLLRRPFFGESWLVGTRGNAARLAASPLRRPVVRLLFAGRVLVSTEVSREEVLSLGLPPNCVYEHAPVVDRDAYRPPVRRDVRDSYRMVACARFDLRQKRLDLLLDAWDRVAPADWSLVLAGDGPDSAEVRRRALSCRGHVELTGWIDDVPDLLAASDALALPTEAENPGYALLEGMACALPCLASDIDVYRRMQPDGVRLVRNDVPSWEAAVRAITGVSPDARLAVGQAGRAWIEQNTITPEQLALAGVLDV